MPKITKSEARKILNKSERAVERYSRAEGDKLPLLSVTYEKGTTRDVPMYDEDEVRELAARLRNPQTAARGVIVSPEGQQTAIATRADNADKLVAILERLSTLAEPRPGIQAQPVESIVDLAHKLVLTEKEAARFTGLPLSLIRANRTKLKAQIIGRGYKVKREALEAFVKKLK
jgi:hypothetical protein